MSVETCETARRQLRTFGIPDRDVSNTLKTSSGAELQPFMVGLSWERNAVGGWGRSNVGWDDHVPGAPISGRFGAGHDIGEASVVGNTRMVCVAHQTTSYDFARVFGIATSKPLLGWFHLQPS